MRGQRDGAGGAVWARLWVTQRRLPTWPHFAHLDAGAFGYHRAASVLADAPGSAPFLAACGASDPRFDLRWSSADVDGLVTAIHHKKTPLRGAGTLDVELVLSRALVPTLTQGAAYEAVVPPR